MCDSSVYYNTLLQMLENNEKVQTVGKTIWHIFPSYTFLTSPINAEREKLMPQHVETASKKTALGHFTDAEKAK